MTIAIVSSILFCYRFFVTFFPILPGYVPATDAQLARMREEREQTVEPVLDVGDPRRPRSPSCSGSSRCTPWSTSRPSRPRCRRSRRSSASRRRRPRSPRRWRALRYPQRPAAYKNFYLLNSASARTPSRTTTSRSVLPPDPRRAHRRGLRGLPPPLRDGRGRPRGEDLKELHAAIDIKLGGRLRRPATTTWQQNPPQSCARCHGLPNEAGRPVAHRPQGRLPPPVHRLPRAPAQPGVRPHGMRLVPSPLDARPRHAGGPHGQAQPAGRDPDLPELPPEGGTGRAEDRPLELEGLARPPSRGTSTGSTSA